MRFDLPKVSFSEQERQLWRELNGVRDQQQFINMTEKFYQLRESGVAVSALTSELIAFEEIGPQMAFFEEKKNQALVHENFITCMSKINKNLNEEKTIQMLVVGTEHNHVFFLDPNGQAVKREALLPSQPVQLICEGQFDIDYRVFAMCRNGSVCLIRKTDITELQV